ncbi:MAG: hypothetical protein V4615_05290 [Bacteroidota bacterium]
MDILNQLVSALSKEELRYFKIFAMRMHTSESRKDFMLLDYMRKAGEKYDDNHAVRKLYGGPDKTNFYRLKNRLLDYLGDYLSFHHIWKSDLNELHRNLSLYHIFLRKSQFKVSLFYLKKAEQKAKAVENFEMLDMIYDNFVKLSNDLLEINPEDYIGKRKANAIQLNKIRETDQALAALNYRLKITQNVASKNTDALKILNHTIKEFTSDEKLKESKSFQTRIYRAVSQILLQQHNYTALEKFLKETYPYFEKQKWFDKENHETMLQMLTYLVNSLFRNNKYEESLKYAALLGQEIKAFSRMLYDKYLFFYYNSLVINYTALDKKKALVTLNEFEKEIRNKKNSYYDQFLFFNRAMILHQLGKPSEAIRNMVRLYVNDNFKKADESFKFKIIVAELIMQFDAGDPESYLLRSRSIKKQFKKLLTGGDFIREKQLIQLTDKMIVKMNYKNDAKLKKQSDLFVKARVNAAVIDSEIINYSRWLAPKWGILLAS